jgi:hypothetical protein
MRMVEAVLDRLVLRSGVCENLAPFLCRYTIGGMWFGGREGATARPKTRATTSQMAATIGRRRNK